MLRSLKPSLTLSSYSLSGCDGKEASPLMNPSSLMFAQHEEASLVFTMAPEDLSAKETYRLELQFEFPKVIGNNPPNLQTSQKYFFPVDVEYHKVQLLNDSDSLCMIFK